MQTLKSFCSSILMIGLLVGVNAHLFADEPSLKIIDKTNWEEVEGLVPDRFLEAVKKGEMTLPVGELEYDETEYFPSYVLASDKDNVGKYELDEEDIIVEAGTGKMAKSIVGFPFPKIDPEDPKVAVKIMYNKQYNPYILGFKKFDSVTQWIGRKTGFEREIQVVFRDAYFLGFPGALERRNPKNVERYSLVSVTKPFDIAGTSQMMWRYLSAKPDTNFAYIPAIRRVRRLSPANRSDGFVGSDMAQDDILAYDGKIPLFDWKLLGTREALVPFALRKPLKTVVNEDDEWTIPKGQFSIRYGHEDKEWQGAPWAPLNLVYIKRQVYVIEAKAKDPYYNYGTQHIWVTTNTWGPAYKVIYDRAGNFWKYISVVTAGYQSDDGKVKFLSWLDHVIVDDRREHATIIANLHPATYFIFNAVLEMDDFSLAGFQKYCK